MAVWLSSEMVMGKESNEVETNHKLLSPEDKHDQKKIFGGFLEEDIQYLTRRKVLKKNGSRKREWANLWSPLEREILFYLSFLISEFAKDWRLKVDSFVRSRTPSSPSWFVSSPLHTARSVGPALDNFLEENSTREKFHRFFYCAGTEGHTADDKGVTVPPEAHFAFCWLSLSIVEIVDPMRISFGHNWSHIFDSRIDFEL
jgi:hypothetical protein